MNRIFNIIRYTLTYLRVIFITFLKFILIQLGHLWNTLYFYLLTDYVKYPMLFNLIFYVVGLYFIQLLFPLLPISSFFISEASCEPLTVAKVIEQGWQIEDPNYNVPLHLRYRFVGANTYMLVIDPITYKVKYRLIDGPPLPSTPPLDYYWHYVFKNQYVTPRNISYDYGHIKGILRTYKYFYATRDAAYINPIPVMPPAPAIIPAPVVIPAPPVMSPPPVIPALPVMPPPPVIPMLPVTDVLIEPPTSLGTIPGWVSEEDFFDKLERAPLQDKAFLIVDRFSNISFNVIDNLPSENINTQVLKTIAYRCLKDDATSTLWIANNPDAYLNGIPTQVLTLFGTYVNMDEDLTGVQKELMTHFMAHVNIFNIAHFRGVTVESILENPEQYAERLEFARHCIDSLK